MVLLTTQIYIIGMVFLGLSALSRTSNHIMTNSTHLTENLLLYIGLCLIALAKAGSNSSCLEDFFGQQLKKNVSNNDITDEKRNGARQLFWTAASKVLGLILGTVLLAVADNWKVLYGFCAILMQFALGLFLIGSPFYTCMGIDAKSQELKCLEKEVSITDTFSPPGKDEAKENMKILLLLVPISVTFLIYGIVKSVGSTFFIDQGNNMKDSQNSRIPVPSITILIIASSFSKTLLAIGIKLLLRNRLTGVRKIHAILIRIGVGLIFTIICCSTAEVVEAKRLRIVVECGLLDITGDNDGDPVIPISVFWLLPQFIFSGATNGLAGDGMESFFESELPMGMRRYASQVTRSVSGIGTLVSVGLVLIAAKASTVGGGSIWYYQ